MTLKERFTSSLTTLFYFLDLNIFVSIAYIVTKRLCILDRVVHTIRSYYNNKKNIIYIRHNIYVPSSFYLCDSKQNVSFSHRGSEKT